MLAKEIENLLHDSFAGLDEVKSGFLNRLERDSLTRDEDPENHFCVFFVPYNPSSKQVMIGDHKKSGLWLFPGGHIDEGESVLETLNREIEEELRVSRLYKKEPKPFLFTKTHIAKDVRSCKVHYDIWYLMETDGSDFNIDPAEYHETQWLGTADARKLNLNPENQEAIDFIERSTS